MRAMVLMVVVAGCAHGPDSRLDYFGALYAESPGMLAKATNDSMFTIEP